MKNNDKTDINAEYIQERKRLFTSYLNTAMALPAAGIAIDAFVDGHYLAGAIWSLFAIGNSIFAVKGYKNTRDNLNTLYLMKDKEAGGLEQIADKK